MLDTIDQPTRCPGFSVQDVLRTDGSELPPALSERALRQFGTEDIPYERYTSRDFLRLEVERVWNRTWQWACREEHLAEAGDYLVYDVGPYSILLVRSSDGAIRGFHNACLHRGTRLRTGEAVGSMKEIRCPYHGWNWHLDGTLKDIPCRWDFPHVDPAAFRLPEVQVASWGGFVFINMDPNAVPLLEYLEVLPRHFQRWPFEHRHVALHVQKELECNWKSAEEAFLEVYHSLETHPQTIAPSKFDNSQYDIFGDHVTRWIALNGVGYEPGMDQQQLLELMLSSGTEGLKVPEGETARKVLARHLRATARKDGVDLTPYSVCELIDPIEYFVFPNMFIFAGILLPLVYRFRPVGMSPDRSVMDLLLLRPNPQNGAPPPPAEVVRLGPRDSFTTVPGLSQQLGVIYDQDVGNLAQQQQGFTISRKRGQTLARYQEIILRNFHRTLDKYLSCR